MSGTKIPYVKNITNSGVQAGNILTDVEVLTFADGAVVDFTGANVSGGVETLTTAGAISLFEYTTVITDPTTYTLENLPMYTLADGIDGQMKQITITDGNVLISTSNGTFVLDQNTPSVTLVYSAGAGGWVAISEKNNYPLTQIENKLAPSSDAVALSRNGKIMVVALYNTGPTGEVRVYTRTTNTWTLTDTLIGTGNTGNALQGTSVSISADTTTIAIGGPADNGNIGAVWVFIGSPGSYTQQGGKLVPGGATGTPFFGTSVSLSADGNTFVAGGNRDGGSPGNRGAQWVFTRSGGVWSQDGPILIATAGIALQGTSVSMSADGFLFVTGAPWFNTNVGAFFIYRKNQSTGNWDIEAGPIQGNTGTVSGRFLGFSSALSADGEILALGGYGFNGNTGGIWTFGRNNGAWTQQDGPLTGSGGGGAQQGFSVAISADGKVIAEGGPADSGSVGAYWLFTNVNGYWEQAGDKKIATGTAPISRVGAGVALDSSANRLIVAGDADAGFTGAVWTFG